MTISSSTARVQYNGNGSTTAFATNFKLLSTAYVKVILTSAAGVDTTQTITTHYTVGAITGSTATITMVTAPASGEKITLKLEVPVSQDTDLVNGQAFNADTVETSLDLGTQVDQAIIEKATRALAVPESVLTSFDGELPDITSDYVLVVNSTSTGFEAVNGLTALLNGVDGTADQVVTTDGNGNLSFATVSGVGVPVTKVTTNTTVTIGAGQDYADLSAALTGIATWVIADDVILTLSIITGVHDYTSTVRIYHPYSNRIVIQGVAIANQAISAVSITSNGTRDHDVTFTLTGTNNFIIGEYANILATGGTGHYKDLRGGWEVTGVAGATITVKNTHDLATLTATVTSGTCYRQDTVLSFASMGTDDAIEIWSSGITIKNLAIVGDGGGDTVGIIGFQGAVASFTDRTIVVNGFSSHGVYPIRGADFICNNVSSCNNGEHGFYNLIGSHMQAVNSVASGNGSSGFVNAGGLISATGIDSHGNVAHGFFGGDRGNAIIQSSEINNNGASGIYLEEGSYADAKSTVLAGNAGYNVFLADDASIDIGSVTATGAGVSDLASSTPSKFLGTPTSVGTTSISGGSFYAAEFKTLAASSLNINGGGVVDTLIIQTEVLNAGTIPANDSVVTNVTVTGAEDIGMAALVNSNAPVAGLEYMVQIDATDNVQFTIFNNTAGGIASGSRTYTFIVFGN